MYMHIVMMAFSPDAGPDFFRTVAAFADRIRAECAHMPIYHFGCNEAARSAGLTHAVVSAFEDAAAHEAYQVSPAHVAMKTFMGPFILRMAVYDGAVPGRPQPQADTAAAH